MTDGAPLAASNGTHVLDQEGRVYATAPWRDQLASQIASRRPCTTCSSMQPRRKHVVSGLCMQTQMSSRVCSRCGSRVTHALAAPRVQGFRVRKRAIAARRVGRVILFQRTSQAVAGAQTGWHRLELCRERSEERYGAAPHWRLARRHRKRYACLWASPSNSASPSVKACDVVFSASAGPKPEPSRDEDYLLCRQCVAIDRSGEHRPSVAVGSHCLQVFMCVGRFCCNWDHDMPDPDLPPGKPMQ